MFVSVCMSQSVDVFAGVTPPACMGHTAVLFGTTLVLFGGRISPAQPLNDVWALHLPTCTWRCIECKGPAPSARFRHTAVACGSSLQVSHQTHDHNCFSYVIQVTKSLAYLLAG